jgi:hypothetical protein
MTGLDPAVIRRLYTTVAVLAFLPVGLVLLAQLIDRLFEPLVPLFVITVPIGLIVLAVRGPHAFTRRPPR